MATATLSRVFAALADPTRRDMVARLSDGDATVGQLAEPYEMSLQGVYKHLKVLEDAGLVSRPPGPQPRIVRLDLQALDLMDTWIERHRARAERRYRRLDALLDEIGLDEIGLDELRGQEHEQDHRDGHRGRPEAAGHPDGP